MKLKSKLAIVFIHRGFQDYFNKIIRQCRYFNLDNDIYILGDDKNDKFNFVHHYRINDYFSTAKDFEDNYYKHMSNNSYEFELFCYQRWFVLYEFMKDKNLDFICVCDSDNLAFYNYKEYLELLPDCDFDFIGDANPPENAFSPAFSFLSIKFLKLITDYFKTSYKEDQILKFLHKTWEKTQKIHNIGGGVSDMTQLYMFFTNDEIKNLNTYSVYKYKNVVKNNYTVVDGNINSNFNYHPEKHTYFKVKNLDKIRRYKDVLIENERAYGFLEDNTKVKFVSLHLNTRAKHDINRYLLPKIKLQAFLSSPFEYFKTDLRTFLVKIGFRKVKKFLRTKLKMKIKW